MGIGEDETEDDLRERVERLEAGMSETASLVEELGDRLREDESGSGITEEDLKVALAAWMHDNRFRFVIPEPEHWPEDVNSREEATGHYSRLAAEDILENIADQ